MNRRRFLGQTGSGLAALMAAAKRASGEVARSSGFTREIAADLVVIGGGLGGCAAAIAAAESGLTVVLTETTDWIGGQLTAQAVPPDEHPWIEQFGSNARYRDLRDGIRAYYRRHYPLTAAARADRHLNPGGGGVSRLCHEPRIALAVLSEMIAPFASGGKLLVLLEHDPIRAEVQGDRVRAVVVRDRRSGDERTLVAPYFADATELGDLLSMAGVEFVTGAEARAETGEPHAPEIARPDDQQGITACFAMDYLDGQDHTIDRPRDYEFWRDFAPRLTPPWPGRLLAPQYTHPVTLKPVDQGFDPRGRGAGLWNYRRIADPRQFEPGTFPGSSGITLVNWPQNDCWLGPLVGPGVTPAQAEAMVAKAKQLSLSLLYWLQTEAPRPDGKAGWPGLRLRPDVVGTSDGLAKAAYIRESRRIRAEFTVVEQHVGTEARRRAAGRDEVSAEPFPDSVGVGSYRIDLHPGTGGTNYIDISSLPFQIPLGALIPRRVENLLPACKNIGTTHITNGCYRLHPVEWAIGEAVGTLVAHCLGSKLAPRGVRKSQDSLAEFQRRLVSRGVELAWPVLTPR
ncbi:FAD-dependent oxidoreductase [Aquisphaera insulae]|uniref:FAD-dependent oxidoreductase n=1 Tax=Aquisphaera insulae TaxID=2712864 RepID=UPI0013ED1097|nr:FAD-dependent oxidoreductase [Aquisphaera insulae]